MMTEMAPVTSAVVEPSSRGDLTGTGVGGVGGGVPGGEGGGVGGPASGSAAGGVGR